MYHKTKGKYIVAKILVVDDEKDARAMIETILSAEGHEVILAEDGVQALESIRNNLPDVMVCDIEMPNLKGFDVLAELRENPLTSTLPIIFLTGRNDVTALVQSMELNVNDFLTKPFAVEELIAAVDLQLKKDRHRTA
jgi:DNA-binding response OmpR family regulator